MGHKKMQCQLYVDGKVVPNNLVKHGNRFVKVLSVNTVTAYVLPPRHSAQQTVNLHTLSFNDILLSTVKVKMVSNSVDVPAPKKQALGK